MILEKLLGLGIRDKGRLCGILDKMVGVAMDTSLYESVVAFIGQNDEVCRAREDEVACLLRSCVSTIDEARELAQLLCAGCWDTAILPEAIALRTALDEETSFYDLMDFVLSDESGHT